MVLFRAVQASNPTSVALIEGSRSVTYGELTERALRTAGGLRAQGVSPGAHVGVACPTGIEAVVAYLGVHAAGAIAVMVNHRNTTPEFEARFAVVDPRLVIVGGTERIELPDGVPMFRAAGDRNDDLQTLDESGSQAAMNALSDTAAVLLTSGVSGAPAAVSVVHRGRRRSAARDRALAGRLLTRGERVGEASASSTSFLFGRFRLWCG